MTEKKYKKILAFERPDLIKEWYFDKNKDICHPDKVTIGSHKKVWWKCKDCGHVWHAAIYHRTKGQGCPECSKKNMGIKILKAKCHNGVNDLATLAPALLEEWDFKENAKILPTEISYSSNKKVWWKCKRCGHEWQATVNNRYRGTNCPRCMRHYHTSYPEQTVYYYLKQVFPDTINGYKPPWLSQKLEVDIYVPSLKLAVEYDGEAYHSNKKVKTDEDKTKVLNEHGITLVRIREPKSAIINDNSIIIKTNPPTGNLIYLEPALNDLISFITDYYKIQVSIQIDIQQDYDSIIQSIQGIVKQKSLGHNNPIVAKEWSYEKNGNLSPFDFTTGSSIKVWWKCQKCGHEWKAAIGSRNAGHGCPVCAGRVARSGVNDLKTLYPDIAKEWSNKNGDLSPDMLLPNSAKKVWWKCHKCGNEWQATCHNRVTNNSGCPICSYKKQGDSFTRNKIKKLGSLAENSPDLLKDWDYKKNQISPKEITNGTNKKAWWKCHICGYEWESSINSRVHGRGCPKCSGRMKKPVLCVETDEEYESIVSAALNKNINKNSIGKCCRGKQKTAGGYHWEYIDKDKDN